MEIIFERIAYRWMVKIKKILSANLFNDMSYDNIVESYLFNNIFTYIMQAIYRILNKPLLFCIRRHNIILFIIS